MTQKSLFAPIAARFDFVFIDQYGVLHDGQTPLSRRDRSARDIEGDRKDRTFRDPKRLTLDYTRDEMRLKRSNMAH